MIMNIIYTIIALNYAGCLYIFISRNCYPNWILNTHLDNSSYSEIYICSIYILIMAITTVGYGDITCYSLHDTASFSDLPQRTITRIIVNTM